MEKHIIALDLDGTLLTGQKTISEKNLKTIQAQKKRDTSSSLLQADRIVAVSNITPKWT